MKITLSRAGYQTLIFDKLPPYATGEDCRKLRAWTESATTEQLVMLYEKIKDLPFTPACKYFTLADMLDIELWALDTANARLR